MGALRLRYVAGVVVIALGFAAPSSAESESGVGNPRVWAQLFEPQTRAVEPKEVVYLSFAEALQAEQQQTSPSADQQQTQTQAQKEAEKPPEPQHTGLSALVRTTGGDFAAFTKRRSTWVILAIGGGAALLTHPVDDNVNARIVGSRAVGRFFAPGKVIGSAYVQMGASVGLYALGRYVLPHAEGEPKTNKISHLGYDLLRAQIVSQAFVQGVKIAVRRDRPTGECCSFPSGHAASAFAAASVLERHFGYRAAWPTLLVASYIGTSRLHDNVHFLSDVLFGSALGMATGWTVVGRHGRSEYALMPVPVRGGFELAFTRVGPRSRPSS
jgi:membrane-associated phospholipid phosphatase